MNAFMTHPSVRIKGTENNYEPVQCVSPNCPNRNPHMHCPFCVTTESYHDPVILKAHYRVKHVDKGIDFAGLKILRCCDHCDIVGTIKGSKEFKGAHWHCYRCRNGFNRRDEAIKHYRTHFRNPQTTFQIQIAQEVYKDNFESANAASTITHIAQDESQEAYTTVQSDGNQVNGKEGEIQVSVAANETVGAEGQTIMIIQADEHLDASQVQNALSNANIQEVANIEPAQTMLNRIDHCEEISDAENRIKSSVDTKVYLELRTAVENLNNNNCSYTPTENEPPNKYQGTPAVPSNCEPKKSNNNIKSLDRSSARNVSTRMKDQNNIDSRKFPYGYYPYFSCSGYFPPYPPGNRVPTSSESHHIPSAILSSSFQGVKNSKSETRIPEKANEEYRKEVSRGVLQAKSENVCTTNKYAQNPEMKLSLDVAKTSTNPLIAAYQQQNAHRLNGQAQYTSSGDAEKEKWEEKVSELQQQLNKADVEHRERESKLRAEISVLKSKLQSQASEIASLQKREQELLSQLSVPLDNHIHELLGQLKSEHEDLLHHQLAQVRRAYIQQYCQETISITTERSSESALSGNIVFVQSPGGSNIRLMEEGSTGELTEGTVGASRIVIMKSEEAHTSENESGREVVDNGTSEIVVDTDDQVKMNSSPQSAVLSSTENETVVEVTVSGVTRNIDIEAEGSEQNEENSEGSSPRAKRRKKSH